MDEFHIKMLWGDVSVRDCGSGIEGLKKSKFFRENYEIKKIRWAIKENNGLQRLSVLYENISNNEFRAKCALFVTDFIDPNMIKVGQNIGFIKQDQYNDIIIINVWCKQFQDTLFNDRGVSKEVDFDSREKILKVSFIWISSIIK